MEPSFFDLEKEGFFLTHEKPPLPILSSFDFGCTAQ